MLLYVGCCSLRYAPVRSSSFDEVDALCAPVIGVRASFEVALGLQVVDKLAHRLHGRFGSVIGPILQEVGFPGEPKLFEVHNFVK